MNIAVFVSGRGSNLQAILSSAELRGLCKVSVVCSDKLDCPAFQIAKQYNIPFFSVSEKVKSGSETGENKFITFHELQKKLLAQNVELIVLAGYLKLLPKEFVRFYPYKMINIHPALLPSFGGKGMYGIHVHEAVFRSSAKVSGATVHFVNENYDEGLIIDQAVVSVADAESSEEIAQRVLKLEHTLLPSVIAKIAQRKIEIKNNRVYLT
ncbi:MAG: phosphoribosylglycinamide formyltransferase [Ignavibacteriaceae bacterium]|jgi:formyltetrahydrofolate-dependent phosphoribosylglycinamide formyltransferase|nr:phosphoribosylglycinamide formyltransferase [Ignavibacteriaceae bacterium]